MEKRAGYCVSVAIEKAESLECNRVPCYLKVEFVETQSKEFSVCAYF
jgi:hypothetical protein